MLREIGSDFWEIPKKHSQSKFGIEGIKQCSESQFYISGRSAIRAFCKNVEVKNKSVLLPAYTCETVILPFEKEQWEIEYYEIQKDFRPNVEQLLKKIESQTSNVLLLQSYFGFDTLHDIAVIIQKCKEKNVIILEDITQSMLSLFPKTEANYYVGSLRKFFAIPEGGILLAVHNHIQIHSQKPISQTFELAVKAFSLKEAYMTEKEDVSKDIFMDHYKLWKQCISRYDDIYPINEGTREILDDIDIAEIRRKRRENYCFLYDNLKDKLWFECALRKPSKEEVPLYFPIYLKESLERKTVQAHLIKKQIYCPVIWPQYVSNQKIGNESRFIYEHILCIPCDQRYGLEEMLQIIQAFEEFENDER